MRCRLWLLGLTALIAAATQCGEPVHAQSSAPTLAGVPVAPSILASSATAERQPGACLPAEIRDLVQRSAGRRRDIEACELACLPRPVGIDLDDAARLQRRHGFQWCRECVAAFPPMTIDEGRGLELAESSAGCPLPQRPQPMAVKSGGFIMPELQGVRALFGAGRPAPEHGNLAVVIGNSNSRQAGRSITRPQARKDAEAMAVLLVERLGYRHGNVIELRDADGRDLDRLLGTGTTGKGALAERLAQSPGAALFVYMSGTGAPGDGGTTEGAYLLAPVSAAPGSATSTAARAADAGYPLARFYQRLADLRTTSTVVVLEMAFGRSSGPSSSPGLNAPETDIQTLPSAVRPGLVVMTAADRDQAPLDDPGTRLSLFTRHLIEGLAGAADRAPAGNNDGVIDTTEAFAYAAGRTIVQARAMHGQLQRPTLAQVKPAILPGNRPM